MPSYSPGLGDSGAYQVSSRPFFKAEITADNIVRVMEFPTVTNWILVRNLGVHRTADGPRIGFSEAGVSANDYYVPRSASSVNDTTHEILYVKVSKIYYKSDTGGNQNFQVIAGLTSIPTGSIPNNWSGSAGVG